MPKTIYTISSNTSSDALFRTWGTTFAAALVAAGFVKTADSGQINWATVTKPVGVNTLAGYEIYRSNDGNGTTIHNYYIKVLYYSGSDANYMRVDYQIGWSTDGAGTINSARKSAQISVQTGSAAIGAAAHTMCIAGNGSWLTILQKPNDQYHSFIGIERTILSDGTNNGEEVVYVTSNTGSSGINNLGVLPKDDPTPTVETNPPYIVPTTGNINFDGRTGVGLLFPQKGSLINPTTLIIGGMTTYFNPVEAQHTISMFGEDREYIWCSSYPKIANGGNPASVAVGGLVRIG